MMERKRLKARASRNRLDPATRLQLESLEFRRVLATFLVTHLTDDATAGSLRTAIEAANLTVESDVVEFTSELRGTIALSGPLAVTSGISIAGEDRITLDAQSVARIFEISDSVVDPISFSGLRLIGGRADAGDGGAIHSLSNATMTIERSSIEKSIASGAGGAIAASGDLILRETAIDKNSAGTNGGGIQSNTSLILDRSTISDNFATGNGGGVYVGQSIVATNSTISQNQSGHNGGGLFAGANIAAESSTIAYNSVTGIGEGGGVYFSGQLTSHRTVFSNNSNPGATSPDIHADVNIHPGVSEIVATNSIVSDRTGTSLIASSMTDEHGNLIGDSNAGGIIDVKLGTLSNYGGRTKTHSLLNGSPAIDAGGMDGVPTEEQRGSPFLRLAGSALDIGAIERQNASLILFVDHTVDENDGDYSTGDLSLREAIGLANGSTGFNVIGISPATNSQTFVLELGQIAIADTLQLDGNGPVSSRIDAGERSRIFELTNNAGSVEINGWTLTRGEAPADENGGAIYSSSTSTLVLNGLIAKDNSANSGNNSGSGGAIYTSGPLRVTDSSFLENVARKDGGAIYASGSVVVANSKISKNQGGSAAVDMGGGMRALGSVTLVGSSVSENTIGGFGGGVWSSGVADIKGSSIWSNVAAAHGSSAGGGVFANRAEVTNSTISSNSADDSGGGIFINGLDQTLFFNSTITQNSAGSQGGGIQTFRVKLDSTIVAENSAGLHADISAVGFSTAFKSFLGDRVGTSFTESSPGIDVDGNFIGDSSDGAGGAIDPLLGVLAFNGGTRKTHALQASSPAIDRGRNSLSLAFDQRGEPFNRLNGLVDIGAYERQPSPTGLVVDSVVDEIDGDYTFGNFSLREAISLANGNIGPDTITFSSLLDGQTIVPTLGPWLITDELTINGKGIELTRMDAQFGSRLFDISYESGPLTIAAVDLSRGLTEGNGGAILSLSPETLTIKNSRISESSGRNGGAIFSESAVVLLESTIASNQASESGGAIYANTDVTISLSTIDNNIATSNGGGIQTCSGSVMITDSTISRNQAANGAGVSTCDGSISLVSSTLSTNVALTNGGGLSSQSGALEITSSTLTGNAAGANGGGLFIDAGTLSLRNSIVAGNSNTGIMSPDIHIASGSASAIHSIVGDKTGTPFMAANPIADADGNLIGDAASPAGIVDPLLGTLAENGGPTRTHALSPGSPAIDAGSITDLSLDQRGAPRISDGDQDGTPLVDIGAFELDERAPRILSVKVGSPEWSDAFRNHVDPDGIGFVFPGGTDQLDNLTWGNISQVYLSFSENIAIDQLDFDLFGVSVSEYPIHEVVNDRNSHLVTITLSDPIGIDKLLLAINETTTDISGNPLDGEWADGQSAISGDGQPGGAFQFRFNVVPADMNNSGAIAVNDIGKLRLAMGSTIGDDNYVKGVDLDGSGGISVADGAVIRRYIGFFMPSDEPLPAAVAATPTLLGNEAERADIVMSLLVDDWDQSRKKRRGPIKSAVFMA